MKFGLIKLTNKVLEITLHNILRHKGSTAVTIIYILMFLFGTLKLDQVFHGTMFTKSIYIA